MEASVERNPECEVRHLGLSFFMLATKLDFVPKATDDDVLRDDYGPAQTRQQVVSGEPGATSPCRTHCGKWGMVAEAQETQNGSHSALAWGEASAGEKGLDVLHQWPWLSLSVREGGAFVGSQSSRYVISASRCGGKT